MPRCPDSPDVPKTEHPFQVWPPDWWHQGACGSVVVLAIALVQYSFVMVLASLIVGGLHRPPGDARAVRCWGCLGKMPSRCPDVPDAQMSGLRGSIRGGRTQSRTGSIRVAWTSGHPAYCPRYIRASGVWPHPGKARHLVHPGVPGHQPGSRSIWANPDEA